MGPHYLEDHPMTCKWLITLVKKSPLSRVDPFPNGRTHSMAYKWGLHPNYLYTSNGGDPPSSGKSLEKSLILEFQSCISAHHSGIRWYRSLVFKKKKQPNRQKNNQQWWIFTLFRLMKINNTWNYGPNIMHLPSLSVPSTKISPRSLPVFVGQLRSNLGLSSFHLYGPRRFSGRCVFPEIHHRKTNMEPEK